LDCGDVTVWDIETLFPALTKAQVFAPIFEDDFWETLNPVAGSAYVGGVRHLGAATLDSYDGEIGQSRRQDWTLT
jgi:hypothetical protein